MTRPCPPSWKPPEVSINRTQSALRTDINITPLIDIVLVLRVPPEMPLATASEALDLVHLAASRIGEAKEVRTVLVEGKP